MLSTASCKLLITHNLAITYYNSEHRCREKILLSKSVIFQITDQFHKGKSSLCETERKGFNNEYTKNKKVKNRSKYGHPTAAYNYSFQYAEVNVL